MTQNTPHPTRRTALRIAATSAIGTVAGCLNGTTNNPSQTDDTQSPDPEEFERIAIEETTLVVELAQDTDLDQLNLIQPNGELFAKREIAAGARQASIELGMDYQSGDYGIVGLAGDETVVETTLSVEPDLQILEMGIGRNQPDEMWDGEEADISDEAFVTIENRGTGPDSITKLLFIGDIPYPSDEEGTNYANNADVSGIYDPRTDSEVEDVLIESGEQLKLYSSRSPFAFVPGAAITCKDEQQSGEFSMTLETQVDGDRLSKTYDIQYSAADERDECEITISEE